MRMNHRYKSAGKVLCLLMLAALFCLAAGCGQQGGAEQTTGDRDTLYQVSLLQGLTMGDFSGSVTAGEGQMLLLSVPYDKGWHITADGEPVTAEQPLPGLTGIPLSAGTHTIRMQFTPQGFAAGCIISTGSWILFLLLCIRKQKKPQRPEV